MTRLRKLLQRRRLWWHRRSRSRDGWHDDGAYLKACIAREKAVYTPSRRRRAHLIGVGW